MSNISLPISISQLWCCGVPSMCTIELLCKHILFCFGHSLYLLFAITYRSFPSTICYLTSSLPHTSPYSVTSSTHPLGLPKDLDLLPFILMVINSMFIIIFFHSTLSTSTIKMKLKKWFPHANKVFNYNVFIFILFFSGGQISIDVFPKGWDKTYCLKFLSEFDEIHFFGDKTLPGGNDYEIWDDSRTVGHTVTSPDDTMKQLKELFEI